MRVIDDGEKNGIYRNPLESINDILPRIPLVTVMLPVCPDSEDVPLRSEMKCEKIVKKYCITFLCVYEPATHSLSPTVRILINSGTNW